MFFSEVSFNCSKDSKLAHYLCVNLKYVLYEIIRKSKTKKLGRWLLKIMLTDTLNNKLFHFNISSVFLKLV